MEENRQDQELQTRQEGPWMRWLPIITATMGYGIWGFSYLFSRVALEITTPAILLSVRYILAALIMTVPVVMGKVKISLRGKDWKLLLLLGILEPVYYYSESYSILYTNATYAGVIVAAIPVSSMIFAAIFLKEYPNLRQVLFAALPICGVILITVSGSSLGIIGPLGAFFLLCTCVSAGANSTAGRKASMVYEFYERTYMVMVISAGIFTAVALVSNKGSLAPYAAALQEPKFLGAALMLSLFCSVAARLCVNYSQGKMAVAKGTIFGAITTLCASLSGVLILHDPFTWQLAVGTVLIIVGVWQVTKYGR